MVYISAHLHFTTKESRIVIMGYEDFTAKLDIQANNSVFVLHVLKRYKKLGDERFSLDLHNFLRLDKGSFDDPEEQEWLESIIDDIRDEMQEYRQCRDQVNDAIDEIESQHPSRGVNPFARNLYVNVLRGNGFFKRYEEDVHCALHDLSAPQ